MASTCSVCEGPRTLLQFGLTIKFWRDMHTLLCLYKEQEMTIDYLPNSSATKVSQDQEHPIKFLLESKVSQDQNPLTSAFPLEDHHQNCSCLAIYS